MENRGDEVLICMRTKFFVGHLQNWDNEDGRWVGRIGMRVEIYLWFIKPASSFGPGCITSPLQDNRILFNYILITIFHSIIHRYFFQLSTTIFHSVVLEHGIACIHNICRELFCVKYFNNIDCIVSLIVAFVWVICICVSWPKLPWVALVVLLWFGASAVPWYASVREGKS